MENAHRVVILGGGFGGLYAAKALRKAPIQLTLVDRRNFHLFQPLLYQVATGSLSPGEIASPLRAILHKQKNTRVLLGEARDLDADGKRVILDNGAAIGYDSLIVATGSTDSYFGHDDWQKNAPGLKSIEHATEIRHKILYAFEAAEREPDPRNQSEWLTFVIVGGGPTGVELAGALAEIAHDTLRHDFRTIRPQDARIFLIEGAPRLLPSYPEDLSAKAEAALVRLKVTPRTGVMVTDINDRGITMEISDGTEQKLAARTVIWAAGVRPSPFGEVLERSAKAPRYKNGQVIVNSDCSVPGHPEIFVIGDLARFVENGKPLPGVAQVPMQQGAYVAKLISARLRGAALPPFHYFDKGNLAVIGRASAVAQIGPLHISGLLAWFTWLFVHLMYLVEFSNRVLVFVQWGFLYLTFDRGARLITGYAPSDQTPTALKDASGAATLETKGLAILGDSLGSSPTSQQPVLGEQTPTQIASTRRVWTRLLAIVIFFIVFEGALFHSGLYLYVVEPDSTSGYMEVQLQNELRRPKPNHNQVLAVGHSRMALLPRVVNEEKRDTGYTFASIGLGGTTPRIWYYALRALDPKANKYTAIIIPSDDYNEFDRYDYQSERESDLHYMIARLGLRDLFEFPWTYRDKKLQWKILRGMLLKGTVYKQDFLAFLDHPIARIKKARYYVTDSAGWYYGYGGVDENLTGLKIDWRHNTIQYPDRVPQNRRKDIQDELFSALPPNEGREYAYLRYWYGRIIDHYRGSDTKLIFVRVPRAPVSPPDEAPNPNSAVRQIASQPNVIILDERLFNQLERPDLFWDGWHLNRPGMEQFSRILATEVRRVLGPPKS
ncbi:MAG: NAD(P)/FAD-dependent oxidoreductase [Bryobacterales bacterium]|nr:NAD(P)/FAD-dependent oxidoreductase [Bryobacterales bacterium]